MELDAIQLFSQETCGEGNYRIPAMVVTKSGTIIAAADERIYGGGDNPNRIDKIVRVSKDNGKTWSEKIVVVKEVGKSKKRLLMEAYKLIPGKLSFEIGYLEMSILDKNTVYEGEHD